jgi:hypothetical protein
MKKNKRLRWTSFIDFPSNTTIWRGAWNRRGLCIDYVIVCAKYTTDYYVCGGKNTKIGPLTTLGHAKTVAEMLSHMGD